MKKVYFETIDKINIIFNIRYERTPIIIKKVILFFIYTFNIILYKQYEDKIVCVLPFYDGNKKEQISNIKMNSIIKKIHKKFKKEVYLFAFASNIKYKDRIKEELEKYKSNNIIWVEGYWIFSYLILDILKYIFNLTETSIKEQNIDMLINNISEISYYILKRIALNAKRVKIVTNKLNIFKKIEKELYDKEGIAIELSNNMKKSLSKSSYIINVDFDNKLFNKYKVNKNAVILNVYKKTKVQSLMFNGINILDCYIDFDDRIKDEFKEIGIYNDFTPNIIYESYLYKKDKAENIIKQTINNKVKMLYLIGNKGKINELEFKHIISKT